MEVLEEEELRTMKEQQKHYSDLMKSELYEAQRMEQAEAKRKEEFERRKKAARDKRKNQILAHKKVICRQTAKDFLANQK
jgi:predicted phosphoribosyltransferase